MGGSASEEFLSTSPIGEDTFVRSPGGYAANVEAVKTVAPAPQSIDGLATAAVHHTPNTATISSLVDLANAQVARADRAWNGADTLKNVVLALT
jgi:prolyl-tRNA synthetase